MTSQWVRVVGLVLTLAIGWMSGPARSAQPMLSQYQHTAWGEKDGSLESAMSVAQTTDGYLWVATEQGLLRFDGVRFVPIKVWGKTPLEMQEIETLLATSDGALWAGGTRHLFRLGPIGVDDYEVDGAVYNVAADSSGAVWATVNRTGVGQGPLCVVRHMEMHCFGKPDIPLALGDSLSLAQPGIIWIGSRDGICRWTEGMAATCFLQKVLGYPATSGVAAILRTRAGEQWLGIGKGPHPYGLGHLVDAKWVPYVTPEFNGAEINVHILFESADNSLWIGTWGQGIYHLDHGHADHFSVADGLTGDVVNDIKQDAEGTVWIATAGGLDSFRKLPVTVFTSRQGLPSDNVTTIVPTRDGKIWVSGSHLTTIQGSKFVERPLAAFTQGKPTHAMFEDQRGRLWIGTDHGFIVIDGDSVRLVRNRLDGTKPTFIVTIAGNAQSEIWAMSQSLPEFKLLHVNDSDYEEAPLLESRWNSLAVDAKGMPWLALTDGRVGVYRDKKLHMLPSSVAVGGSRSLGFQMDSDDTTFAFRDGLLVTCKDLRHLLSVENGLPCKAIVAAVRGVDKALWLRLECGIVKIDAREFERWFSEPTSKIALRYFDVSDGFRAGSAVFSPRASVAPDGRIWFSTDSSIQVIDPLDLGERQRPPPVLIEEVIADRISQDPGSRLELPPRTRDIEIRYTALSFVVPKKVRFKYRLEGRDTHWTDADTRRVAFYNDLGPGAYRFHVIACNSDGVWNDTGASTEFEVQAAYYQTRWFAAACLAGVLSLLYLAYLYRLRQLAARYRDRLAAKYAERERIARDLHDTLLQSTEGMVLIFQAASDRLGTSDPARNAIDRALVRASSLIAEGRDRVQQLRRTNAETTDLVAELRTLGDALSLEHGAAFDLEIEGTPFELEPATRDEIYLILREGLSNAFQHAAAVSIEMLVRYAVDGLHATIRDDGHGIDIAAIESGGLPGHWGVKGMQERALRIRAVLEIRSRVGGGTEIELFVAGTPTPATHCFDHWFERVRRAFGPGQADDARDSR